MPVLGRNQPVVTIREIFRPASCYRAPTGRVRPKADTSRDGHKANTLDYQNMPAFTDHTPREILTASAIVFVWAIFFAAGAFAGYGAVRDSYYGTSPSQNVDGKVSRTFVQ